jgi:hypothetical protein
LLGQRLAPDPSSHAGELPQLGLDRWPSPKLESVRLEGHV